MSVSGDQSAWRWDRWEVPGMAEQSAEASAVEIADQEEEEYYDAMEEMKTPSATSETGSQREDEVHEAQEQEEVCFTDLDTGRKYVVNVNDLHPVYSPSEKQNTEQDEPQRFSSGGSGQQRRRSLDELQRKAKGASPLMHVITEREQSHASAAPSGRPSENASSDDHAEENASSAVSERDGATSSNSMFLKQAGGDGFKKKGRKPLHWLYKRSRELRSKMKDAVSSKDSTNSKSSHNSSCESPHDCQDSLGGIRQSNESRPAPSAADGQNSHYEKVQVRRKAYKEFPAVLLSQSIHAHEGPIWVIKFSCDGKYLATAGQDAIVKIWEVKGEYEQTHATSSTQADCSSSTGSSEHHVDAQASEAPFKRQPYRVYVGHKTDVLDLSWSSTQFIISSSMDRSVRLWHLTLEDCLRVFSHNDFVTTIDFNPSNDKYFISGSLDGLVRLWYIPDHRVADYVKVGEMVTAAAFSPNAKSTVAGSYKGKCHFYAMDNDQFEYVTTVDVRNKRSSHPKGRKITGLQFLGNNSKKLLVTSNDSRIRVYDGYVMRCKYKGHRNRNSQIRASFSPDGNFIVCGSEDDKVYIWSTVNSYVPMINPLYTGFRRDKHSSYERFKAQEEVVTAALFAPEPVRQAASSNNARQRWMAKDGNDEGGGSPTEAAQALVKSRLRSTSPVPLDGSPSANCGTSPRRSDAAEAQEAVQHAVEAGASLGQVVLTAGYTGELRIYENHALPMWL